MYRQILSLVCACSWAALPDGLGAFQEAPLLFGEPNWGTVLSGSSELEVDISFLTELLRTEWLNNHATKLTRFISHRWKKKKKGMGHNLEIIYEKKCFFLAKLTFFSQKCMQLNDSHASKDTWALWQNRSVSDLCLQSFNICDKRSTH